MSPRYSDQQIIAAIKAAALDCHASEGAGVTAAEVACRLNGVPANRFPLPASVTDGEVAHVARRLGAMKRAGAITGGTCYREAFYRAVSAASVRTYLETGAFPTLIEASR